MECIESKNFYFDIRNWLLDFEIVLPECNKTNIILGVDDNTLNYIILMYKLQLYKAREKRIVPNVRLFKNLLRYNQKIENKLARQNITNRRKWEKLSPALN